MIGGAGSKKDPRVYRVERQGSLDAFLSLSSVEVSFHKLALNKEGGDGGTSTLGERSTTESCMLRSGRMSRF